MDADFPQRPDLEFIARADQRRRPVFFDHCRPRRRKSRLQSATVEYARFNEAIFLAEIDRTRRWSAARGVDLRQTGEIGTPLPGESRQVQRLQFRRILGVRVAITPL